MKKILGFVGLLCFIFAAQAFAAIEGTAWVKAFGIAFSVGAANVLGFIEGLTT